jgi:hypothetical protein
VTATQTAPARAQGLRAAASSRLLWLGASLLALLVTLWPVFRIRFGIVDDHEIVDILDGRPRLPLLDVPGAVVSRTNEPLGRFRPLYWVGRVLEAAVAGDHPTWWYVDRFVLAGAALVVVYLVLVRVTAPPLAAVLALLPFLGAQAETWYRLGPNEAYAVPLFALGVALVLRGLAEGVRPAQLWPGFAFLVAAGLAKESFIPVTVVLVAWACLRFGVRRWQRRDWAVVGATAVVTLADLALLLRQVTVHGDVYAQPRTPVAAVRWLGFAVANLTFFQGLLAAVIAVAVLALLLGRRLPGPVWRDVTVVGLACLLSQVAFYAGAPSTGRYLYPTVFLGVLVWGVAAAMAEPHGAGASSQRRTAVVVIACVLALVDLGGMVMTRSAARDAADASLSFQSSLHALEQDVRSSEVSVVVLQPHDAAADVEATLSLARYLTTSTGATVMTLPAETSEGPDGEAQATLLRHWSRQGFNRLTPYRPGSDCLSVVFGKGPPVCGRSVPPPR